MAVEGARPYKFTDYCRKISVNLQNFKKDGRFCDVVLISGEIQIEVGLFYRNYLLQL